MMSFMAQAALIKEPEWTLGWKLRRSLEAGDVSVQDMASRLEVSRATVSRWLHDEIRPKNIYLKEWALACGVPYDWLLRGRDSNSQPTDYDLIPLLRTLGNEPIPFRRHTVNIFPSDPAA